MVDIKKLKYSPFKNSAEWREWLEENHSSSDSVWIQFYKKASGKQSFTYDEALDEALCYGWIDSLTKRVDEISYIQKFSPRKSKSIWSKINRNHIQRLINEKRMKPAGMKVVEEAKKDGRWEAAYDSPSTSTLPKEFLEELDKNSAAKEFYSTLNKTNTYAIAWRLQTAKRAETKQKRIHSIIEMLSQKKQFH